MPNAGTPEAMRELDAIAATGEQVSVGLLALALQAQGLQAVSYGGWQVPIKTDSAFTKARITHIDDTRVRADLAAGRVSLPRLARLLEQRFGTPAGVSVAEATRAAVDDLLGQRVLRRVDDDEEEQMDALRARLADLGVAIPDILLPRPSVDLHRWAVIACDQFTSQPDYWQRVEGLVGSANHAGKREILVGNEARGGFDADEDE